MNEWAINEWKNQPKCYDTDIPINTRNINYVYNSMLRNGESTDTCKPSLYCPGSLHT